MEWISVKKKKPEIYEDVFLYTSHDVTVIGSYMGHSVYAAESRYPVLGQCKPTHWMPLPKPPKD